MNIYVGRLSHSITDLHLQLLFGHFGEVRRAEVVTDPVTGESRGFGFVVMADHKKAMKAIDKLDGVKLEDSRLLVKPARTEPRN